MKMRSIFRKGLSVLLSLIIMCAMLPITAFAEQTQGAVDVPTIKGGGNMEKVEVTVTVTKEDDGTTTTKKETPEGGFETGSGLTAEYKSEEVTAAQPESGGEGELIRSKSEYTVANDEETYGAKGGSTTAVSEGDGSEGDIVIGLFEDGQAADNLSGSSGTSGTITKPTGEGDKLKAEDLANYDQTTTTTTDRTASAEVSEITTKAGDPVFEGENGDIEPDADDGYYYYWVNGYDGIGDDIHKGEEKYTVVCSIVDKDGNRRTVKSDIVYNMFVRYENVDDPKDPQNGKLTGGLYCVDFNTDARCGYAYRKVNLEDAAEEGYYSEEEAAQLRAIMNNGFIMGVDEGKENSKPTGVESNKTNFVDFKAGLEEAVKKGTLTDAAIINALESLTWEQAAVATQMAVWTVANRIEVGENETLELKTGDDVINALSAYLLSLRDETKETQIINEKKFVDDLELVIGSRAEKGADAEHDVYNVDLKFSLVVTPGKKDELVVKILDRNGKTISSARIPRDENDTEELGYAKTVIGGDGTTYYVLEGLKLEENSDAVFSLKLEGVQYLDKGVYVFQSGVANGKSVSQNLIGSFEGNAEVDVSMNLKLKFSVKEATVITSREWRTEWSDSDEHNENQGDEDDDKKERKTEKRKSEESKPEESKKAGADGDGIRSGGAPKTGDDSHVSLWIALLLVGCLGILEIIVYGRKRKEDAES